MKHTIKRFLAVVAACTAILIIATTTRADGFGAGRGQRAEVRFMEAMIDHHAMARSLGSVRSGFLRMCMAAAGSRDL